MAVQTISLLIMAWLMKSVVVDNLGAGIVPAAVRSLLDALLWPLLSSVLVSSAVLTLDGAALLLNGVMG